MLDVLFDHIDAQRELLVNLQTGMTRLPAIGPDNGGDGEQAKADYIKEQLCAMGFPPVVDIDAPDQRVSCGYRPNFYCLLPGKDKSRTLWILAHIDVVPPGDLSLWRTDPYKMMVDGDFIYGRGVEDNQQAVASAILALKAFVDSGIEPACNLALFCVSDEETNNEYGAEYVANKMPELFGPDDVMLVPDFGNQEGNMLELAEKGVLWFKFTVHGEQCHASTPNEGVNSLVACSDFILRLNHLNQQFADIDELFDPPCSTFTPTRKEANVPNINTMPGRDVFYMDCRLLPVCNSADVIEAVRKIALDIEQEHAVRVEIEIEKQVEPAPATDYNHPFVQALAGAVKEVYDVVPSVQGIGGNTVAAVYRKLGIPCAVWARLVSNAHMANECSRLSWTMGDAKVICNLALKLDKV